MAAAERAGISKEIVIVGNGDIASALIRAQNKGELAGGRLYCAAGVSNPNETNEEEFHREKELLRKKIREAEEKGLQLVYFSTLAAAEPTKPYHHHKIGMEKLIQELCPNYVIARLGIITWGDNPHTTINFLRSKVERNEQFSIRDVTRDVLEEEEFIKLVNRLPYDGNHIVDFHGRTMTEQEIFYEFVLQNHD